MNRFRRTTTATKASTATTTATALPVVGRRRPVALATAVLAASLAGPANAIVVTWNGNGSDDHWTTGFNWAAGLRPVDGDSLLFQGNSRLLPVNDFEDLSVAGIEFGAGAGAFNLTGERLISRGNIVNNSSNLQSIHLGLTLGTHQTWTGGSAGLVFNGPIDNNDKNLTLSGKVIVNNTGMPWVLGVNESAHLTVRGGAQLSTGIAVIGDRPGSHGSSSGVSIAGAGSRWSVGGGLGTLVIGRTGNAQLLMSGGLLESGDAFIAGDLNNPSGANSFVWLGAEAARGTVWTSSGTVHVGSSSSSNATLWVEYGSTLSSENGRIGLFAGGSGTVRVGIADDRDGTQASWTIAETLDIGVEGNGSLTVNSGGRVSAGQTWIGGSSFADGVSGVGLLDVKGASFSSSGHLAVGYRGTGTLNISQGGRVDSLTSTVGDQATALGTVHVSGAGSLWANSERLDIGGDGIGRMTVSDGATVSNSFAIVGGGSITDAMASSVTVTGAGSSWASSAIIYLNNGAVLVEAGGLVSAAGVQAGSYPQGRASLTVQGGGSRLVVDEELALGSGGPDSPGGSLSLFGGGSVSAGSVLLGNQGQLAIDGGTLNSRERLAVNGRMTLGGGGRISSATGLLGEQDNALGTVEVSGSRTQWNNSGRLDIGRNGIGHMTVADGGHVSNEYAFIGADSVGADLASSVTVTGAISSWDSRASLYVNNGALSVEDGGVVSAANVIVGDYARGAGSITVQGANSRLAVGGQIVLAGGEADSPGGSLSLLDGGSANATGLVLGAPGRLHLDGGTLNLVHSSDTQVAGSFVWTRGLLHFSGDASFADGTLLRNVSHLASGMTLAVDGRLDLGEASSLSLAGGTLQAGTIRLAGVLTVGAGSSVSTATELGNDGSLQLAGGTLSGAGVLVNRAELSGHGRIDMDGGFTNTGLLTQSGGKLVLNTVGSNLGSWNLLAGRQLEISDGGVLINMGQVNLNGGVLVGAGALINDAAGTVSGSGRIDSAFFNAGSLVLGQGLTWINESFGNRGQIFLGSHDATLAGGQIGNHGLIQGLGKISSNISNIDRIAVIEAQGGTLTLSGQIVSPNGGTLAAGSGAKLLIKQGLASNAGQIQLAGGTLDNNNKVMENASNGVISGYGTLRTGGLTQNGQIQLSGGAAQASNVYGSVLANAGSKTILSGNSNTTFHDAVDVQGGAELRVSGGSVATFFGLVQQRSGAQFTGTGSKHFEGGLTVGASPGLGTDEGDVEFGASNYYLAEIGGTSACTLACATPGALTDSSFDKYSVAGQLSLGGTLRLVSWNGFVAQAGQQFDLLDWGSVSGSFASIDASGFTLAAGTALDTSQLYTSGTISVTAVPEPSTLALWLAGLFSIGSVARRRRQRT